jgi:hypothetical protein
MKSRLATSIRSSFLRMNLGNRILVSTLVAVIVTSLSLDARAQDERAYGEGPVTEEDYIRVEYGHFEKYVDWLNSTWKP